MKTNTQAKGIKSWRVGLICSRSDRSPAFAISEWLCSLFSQLFPSNPGGGVLPYMDYIGMCRCEGYGFQAVYSRVGYINQKVWI